MNGPLWCVCLYGSAPEQEFLIDDCINIEQATYEFCGQVDLY
jgi:hypothetical protein